MAEPKPSLSSEAPSMAFKRLMKDLHRLKKEPPSGYSAAPRNVDNILAWLGVIFGPADSPFENGIFYLSLNFTEKYPFEPPKVKFLTEIFHPNVFPDGQVCMDILREKWAPTLDVDSILLGLLSLLTDPHLDSPANSEAAKLYSANREAYNKIVRKLAEQSLESAPADLDTLPQV